MSYKLSGLNPEQEQLLNDVKIIINSFCVYDNGPSNIPVMYFQDI